MYSTAATKSDSPTPPCCTVQRVSLYVIGGIGVALVVIGILSSQDLLPSGGATTAAFAAGGGVIVIALIVNWRCSTEAPAPRKLSPEKQKRLMERLRSERKAHADGGRFGLQTATLVSQLNTSFGSLTKPLNGMLNEEHSPHSSISRETSSTAES